MRDLYLRARQHVRHPSLLGRRNVDPYFPGDAGADPDQHLQLFKWTLNRDSGTAYDEAWSPGGGRLAVAGLGRGPGVVDIGTGEQIMEMSHADLVSCISWCVVNHDRNRERVWSKTGAVRFV